MTTYYRNKQGRVFSAMPWRFVDYWRMTHDVNLNEYQVEKGRAEKELANRLHLALHYVTHRCLHRYSAWSSRRGCARIFKRMITEEFHACPLSNSPN